MSLLTDIEQCIHAYSFRKLLELHKYRTCLFLGILTVLKFPYPRSVKEPEVYDSIRVHAEGGTTEASQKPTFAVSV